MYHIRQPNIRQHYQFPMVNRGIAGGYDHLNDTNRNGFVELVKHDRRAARHDETYELRNASCGCNVISTARTTANIEQFLHNLPLSQWHKDICRLLSEGYSQHDIAESMDVWDDYIKDARTMIGRTIKAARGEQTDDQPPASCRRLGSPPLTKSECLMNRTWGNGRKSLRTRVEVGKWGDE